MDRRRLNPGGGYRPGKGRQGQAQGQGTASNGERIEDGERFHEGIMENTARERTDEGDDIDGWTVLKNSPKASPESRPTRRADQAEPPPRNSNPRTYGVPSHNQKAGAPELPSTAGQRIRSDSDAAHPEAVGNSHPSRWSPNTHCLLRRQNSLQSTARVLMAISR